MTPDVERIRRLQAALRAEAMKYSVEEALNAFAGMAAEIIGTFPKDDRPKLFAIYGKMVGAGIDQVAETERGRRILPGLGAPLQ
jgi:hypothetical protein